MSVRGSIIAMAAALFAAGAFAQGTSALLPKLQNSGYENPAIAAGAEPGGRPVGWLDFASDGGSVAGITDEKKRGGVQSILLKCQEKEDAFHGLYQKFAAAPNHRYTFSMYALNDANDPLVGNSYGQLGIEWKSSDGQEISRVHGPLWNFELSATRWEKFTVEGTAPEGAESGIATMTFFSKDSGGFGTCYIDDAAISVKKP